MCWSLPALVAQARFSIVSTKVFCTANLKNQFHSRSFKENLCFNHCSIVPEKVPFLALLHSRLSPVSIIPRICPPLHVLYSPVLLSWASWGRHLYTRAGTGLMQTQQRWTGEKRTMEEGFGVDKRLRTVEEQGQGHIGTQRVQVGWDLSLWIITVNWELKKL